MSRMSSDHRSAGEELKVVLTWTLITLILIAIIGIGTFLWAFNMLHYQ